MKLILLLYVVFLLTSCDSNHEKLFDDRHITLEIEQELSNCYIQCDNMYSDNAVLPYCYKDTCNSSTLFVLYTLDENILKNYITNSDLSSMKNSNTNYSVPIDNYISNDKINIEQLNYRFNVEPFTFENEIERIRKVSYVTYTKMYLDRKGYISIEVRKRISEFNIINDLNWSKQYTKFKIDWL